ncbi:serine hydrolase domain-containing protein [Steroidobacter agaridevorans]|uniref:serine hydrolase domain-containing protein n=1 Tax=Steroidobacter agaridevorans TaxID=2695856 RepID=UPI0013796FF6|nr:serine hydrolase domain-containing protein [Steroidobacter agaridevorans]
MSKSRAGVPPARAAAHGSWLALALIALFAQPALSEGSSADKFVAAAIDKGQYLGAVTLIARHGKVVSWKAHGRRELGSPDALEPDAIFRIYSMTKPITSVAALMLMEQGKFQLDDPVSKYLPEFGEVRVLAGGTADAPELRAPKRPMTIRQLFVHAAGLAGGEQTPPEAMRLIERAELHRATDLQSYVRMLSQVPLAADPGALFNYDGVHTNVLARLVEVWSGQRFDRYLQERIFAPLRMQDTGFTVPVSQRHRIAQMTATDAAGRLIPSATYAGVEPGRAINLYFSGAGGLYSTAADYLRFAQMLLEGGELEGVRILSRETVSLMMTNQLGTLEPPQLEFRPGEGFGLGGSVAIDPARRARVGSVGDFGWFGAASTYFTIDPREGLIAMLFMQHLPEGSPVEPPKLSGRFYTLVYQSLVQ